MSCCAEGGAFNKTLETRERLPDRCESGTRVLVYDSGVGHCRTRALITVWFLSVFEIDSNYLHIASNIGYDPLQ